MYIYILEDTQLKSFVENDRQKLWDDIHHKRSKINDKRDLQVFEMK